ncbi:hypothetical protein D187_008823 [Cystobacter fuscus DSM 2262]|jgi:uncharacterized protein DUF998|uniref:DUF998 domain-containing protein n=1 Tax=Cystobacter fuscus (strain ATCC 25194 / DSM 2262 / NBRC 100088 / M29) TaxID=1242864 RepID=S9PE57_CYSF2|nr:DUF998 domain-containing protein [Cystobacter fuscus]EPX62635.1 hypothetical protein D187_008823 [Cystobacter fuscus DSM 2262]
MSMTLQSARIAFWASSVALLSLLVLHVLRPDLVPTSHMISEYAIGPYGAVMGVSFGAFALGSLALLVALVGQARGWSGRMGLVFLFLTAVGLALGGAFPMDPTTADQTQMSFSGRMHGVGFMIGVPSELLAVLFVSLALRRQAPWSGARLPMWAAAVWLSLVVMVPLLMQMRYFGIPNRTFMVAYGIWIMLAARPLMRTHPVPTRPGDLIPG